jgi:TrkA domain protein
MTDIQETQLPGVGIRHDFETAEGRRLGVITHRAGRRDLLLYSADDPDACTSTVHLSDDEAHVLADVLGGSRVARSVAETLQSVDGIAIDWLLVTAAWECAGHPLRDMNLRERTGVTVVAVVRDGQTIPAPGPDLEIHADDIVVVVGTPQGVATAFEMLNGR